MVIVVLIVKVDTWIIWGKAVAFFLFSFFSSFLLEFLDSEGIHLVEFSPFVKWCWIRELGPQHKGVNFG